MSGKVNSRITETAVSNPDGQGGCFSDYLQDYAGKYKK